MSKKDTSIGSPTNTVSFYTEQPDTTPVDIANTTVKTAQPSLWIQSALVRASDMCTISTTQLHCPNVSTVVPDSSPNTFPEMVMPVALLMYKEVLWSCYSVTCTGGKCCETNIEETV